MRPMGRRQRRWHDGTWVCSLAGHVTPAATVAELRDDDAPLGVALDDGTRMVRCLRCDLWLRLAAPTGDAVTSPEVPPLGELVLPLRDRALHDRLILRLIALERALHVLLFAAVAIAAAVVETNLGSVEGWAGSLLDDLQRGVAQTARSGGHGFIIDELRRLADVDRDTLWLVVVGSTAYALLEGVEAVRVWLGRRWAEYLTVVATVGLMPLELRDLAEGVTPPRVLLFAVNLAILVWLVWAKRLFGLRGGRAASEHPTDWVAVLADPRTGALEARVEPSPPTLPEPPTPRTGAGSSSGSGGPGDRR